MTPELALGGPFRNPSGMVTDHFFRTHFFRLALIAMGWTTVMRCESGTLVSGPMLGYSEHREVLVWIEVEGADSVSMTYWKEDGPDTIKTIEVAAPPPHPAGGSIVKFRPGLLDPGTAYPSTASPSISPHRSDSGPALCGNGGAARPICHS